MILLIIVNILIETLVAFFLGYCRLKQILAVVFVNLFTQTLLLYYISRSKFNIAIIIIFLELLVIITEWLLLMFALQENKKKLFYLSATMNIISFWLGDILISAFLSSFWGFWF